MVSTFNKGRTVGLVTALCVGVLFAQGPRIVQAEEAETVPMVEVESTASEEGDLMEVDEASEVRSRGISTGLTAKQKKAMCMSSPKCKSAMSSQSGGRALAPGKLSASIAKPAQKWCVKADPTNAYFPTNNGAVAGDMWVENWGGRTRQGVYQLNITWPGAPRVKGDAGYPVHKGMISRGIPKSHVKFYINPPSPGLYTVFLTAVNGSRGGTIRINAPDRTLDIFKPVSLGGRTKGFGFLTHIPKAGWYSVGWVPGTGMGGWTFLESVEVEAFGHSCP